jgi:murein DD-endopeptidase MepM/ murein hydrolase activator NlpD
MRKQVKSASLVPFSGFRLPRKALQLSGICALALSLGACGSDVARFGGNPFSNPFSSATTAAARDPATTGSIKNAAKPVQGAITSKAGTPGSFGQVQSSPLTAPANTLNQQAAQRGANLANADIPTGSINPAAAAPVAAVRTAAVPGAVSRVSAVTGNAAGWTAQGGTPVVLAHGETVDTLSGRYGVPAAAILSANGLSSASAATPGSKVVIPVYNVEATRGSQQKMAQANTTASDADNARPAPPRAVTPVAEATKKPEVKAAATGMSASEMRAAAEAKTRQAREAKEAKSNAAGKAEAKAKAAEEAKAKAEARLAAETAKRQKVAALAPDAEPKTTASVPKDAPPKSADKDEAPKADFRWPARGRVINGFSGKGGNEGINIAVPEGTPVKAAEGGTVAYSGSELKGYGNLVLIRHDNGYVSAYAHNGELNVKRGEKVSRGQVIAKSGQSGNVSSPQLHFELRKGSNPVDPSGYLQN